MAMLPSLEAQSELATINAMSIAMGGVKQSDRQRYLSRLERAANGAQKAAPATPEALSAMGVTVVIVDAETGEEVDG